MKRLIWIAAVLVGLAAVPVLAQPPQGPGPQGRGGRMGGPGGPMLGMLRGLNLTDAQKDQLHALMEQNRPTEPPKAPELERQLHQAILGGTADPSTIENLKAQLNAAHAEDLDRQIAILEKVAQILTPEQRQQLLNEAPRRRGRGGPK